MPKVVEHGLTAVRVRQEKRPGRYADGAGLYLNVVSPTARFFEWRGTIHGKRRTIAIGPVRLHKLADARETAREWSKLARAGGDPRQTRGAGMTFEKAAEFVHAERIAGHVRNAKHDAQWLSTLRTYVFPTLGSKPVDRITQSDVHSVLLPIWTTIPETARRVRQRVAVILDWCITKGHREAANPVAGVEKALPAQRRVVRHHRALDWQELPAFMRRVEVAEGVGARAVRFAILTAARSGEVRGATWREIDLAAKRWTIPADRMKAHRAHVVPLSDAAIVALGQVAEPDDLIFPGTKGGPLSDMSLAAVLKRMQVDATVHGFRATFRTWAEEITSYPRSVVETALAHSAAENAVERAYLRSDLFQKRIALMDDWTKALSA